MLGRGYACRQSVIRQREEELIFLGMAPRNDNYNKYLKEKNMTYIRRKQIQMENREGYENALESLKNKIIEEEGAEKRDELRKDRTAWITDRIAQAKFPDDLDQYYTVKKSSSGTGIIGGVDSSAGGKAEEKDRRGSKGSKGSKGDKGDKEEKEGNTDKGKKSDKTGKDKDEGKGRDKDKDKGGGMDTTAISKPQPKSEVSPLSLICSTVCRYNSIFSGIGIPLFILLFLRILFSFILFCIVFSYVML